MEVPEEDLVEVLFFAVVVFFAVEDLLEAAVFFAVVLFPEVDFLAVVVLDAVFAMIIPPFGVRVFFSPIISPYRMKGEILFR